MRNILQILLIAFILNSCGEYQKVLKSNDYDYKYDRAVSYYEDGDYNRAMPLFNELSSIMKGTSKISDVSYYYAYCNYLTGDNLLAAYLFRNYTLVAGSGNLQSYQMFHLHCRARYVKNQN